jgi:hypothetical protein
MAQPRPAETNLERPSEGDAMLEEEHCAQLPEAQRSLRSLARGLRVNLPQKRLLSSATARSVSVLTLMDSLLSEADVTSAIAARSNCSMSPSAAISPKTSPEGTI